ncbi:MAG: amidohydrolase [Polyangiaceae bacterium]
MIETCALVNADVRTLDPRSPRADSIAWRAGRILAVGARQEVEAALGAHASIEDAGGRTVLPGFIDAHQHPCIVAIYGGAIRLSPPAVHDIPSLLAALREAAARAPAGEWIVAADWDELHLAERRKPTREELDSALPDHPLLALHYSCHRAVANSRALALAGIDRHTPEPSGGTIGRGRGGEPDGLLIERGMSRVESLARASLVARDAEAYFQRLRAHHEALARVGITRVVDATVPTSLAALYREAERGGHLLVPTVMLPVSDAGWLEEPLEVLDGPRTGEGSDLLSVGPVKLVFDGAPACAMCIGWWQLAGSIVGSLAVMLRDRSLDSLRAMTSLAPRYGAKIRTGITIYPKEDADRVVRRIVERGFGVATHAVGNEAIATALGAYEACGGRLGEAAIPRLEHAQFMDRALIERVAASGAAVVTQPHFVSLPAFSSAPSIPGLKNGAVRWLLDAGVKVAGSSDFPVAGFDPLDGIRSAVTRRTARGYTLEEDQAVTLDEAIAMYTRVAAEVSGGLAVTGTLEPGKRADLVILDGALDRSTLADRRVETTVIGGRVAHGARFSAGSGPGASG